MYRSVRADGKHSDIANLSRAKDAALGAAIRDLAWDTANSPRKAQQIGGVFHAPLPPMRPISAHGPLANRTGLVNYPLAPLAPSKGRLSSIEVRKGGGAP